MSFRNLPSIELYRGGELLDEVYLSNDAWASIQYLDYIDLTASTFDEMIQVYGETLVKRMLGYFTHRAAINAYYML